MVLAAVVLWNRCGLIGQSPSTSGVYDDKVPRRRQRRRRGAVGGRYFSGPTRSSFCGFGASSAAIPAGVLKTMFIAPALVPMSCGLKMPPPVQLAPPASGVGPLSEHGLPPPLISAKSMVVSLRLETINGSV